MKYYEKDGDRYVSVTSVIGLMYPFNKAQFTNWCITNGYNPDWVMEESQRIGTRGHEYFENRALGMEFFNIPIGNGLEDAVNKFFNDGWEIVDTEKEVYCREYLYAGRIDAVAKNEKLGIEKALLDFKFWGAWQNKPFIKYDSSKVKKVRLQTSMYKYALGDDDIEQYVVVPSIDGTYHTKSLGYDLSWQTWINNNRDKMFGSADNDNFLE